MNYEYIKSSIERENLILPNSDKINPFLLKNNKKEIIDAINFIASNEKFLYIHGFIGTGKRQFVNYVTEFLNDEVIKLEYYCKEATVCDDILLAFIDTVEKLSIAKAVNLNTKIATLNVKFQQLVSSIKKPFLIVLHSMDDISPENLKLASDAFANIAKEDNVKIIISTRAMHPAILGDLYEDKKITLKAFSKDIFEEYVKNNGLEASDKNIEDFYEQTGGYYYYTALAIKIIQAMKLNLAEFIQKIKQSEMSFDLFLGMTYINIIPTAIRNFFWFLRTVRHGMTLNALAVYDVYDEFAIQYLKNNLMLFESDEMLYVQDYFLQKIDISIPQKTQVKLHKYIIGIYEKELKESLQKRSMLISRQAMRAEIEYHNKCIYEIENNTKIEQTTVEEIKKEPIKETFSNDTISKLEEAKKLYADKSWTSAIEKFLDILKIDTIDLFTVIEVRNFLAKLYKQVGDYSKSAHYYELVETYYKQHNEVINLNYLYYEMVDLYYKTYKNDRAIEVAKKVIYSVDTPQTLLVSTCILLGNIYSDMNNYEEAYNYYKKALDSLEENVDDNLLAELYFKFALANDDKGEEDLAFEYYNKCISLNSKNDYKALSYSNLASCYFENSNLDEALACFIKAYEIDKSNNNYDGIYYNATYIAKIYREEKSKKAVDYLIEAKRSADFLNEDFYMIEASLALGDYYYDNPKTYKDALNEYFRALKIAGKTEQKIDISKIEKRIDDMRLRMSKDDFKILENKYE